MSDSMVQRLVLKDWYFQRWAILGYLAAGAVALILLAHGGEGAFYAGAVLLLTVLITVGIHLTMATVIAERSQQTLSFVMSLPISPRQYTTAKILANVLIFLVPWATLLLGSFAVIASRSTVADGLIPFTAVILGEIFASYTLLLAIAVISESQGWTIGGIVFGNLFFQGFLYWTGHMPVLVAANDSNSIEWGGPVAALLLGELAVIVLSIGTTFYLQARKKDFL
jgi:ABC-2 type transport system permease protein